MRLGQTSVVHLGSQIVASLAGFVATLYIARELGSSVLGTYAIFAAVLIWSRTFTGIGIKDAVKKRLSETRDDAGDVTAGFVIQAGAYLIAAGIALLVAEPLNEYLRFEGTNLLVITLGLTLVFTLVTAVLEGEQKVHVSALLLSLDRIVRSAVQLAVVFLGVLGGGLVGLVWGYAAGVAVAAAVGAIFFGITFKLPTRENFRRILSFARYAWLSGIEGRSFSSLDTIVLGVFVVPSLIGYYEVAWNLASILAVFGTSISTTLFPAFSELSSKNAVEEVGSLLNDALAYTGLFLVPGLVGAFVLGDRVLSIYGQEFVQGATILTILVLARLVYAYEAQFVSTLNAINHPEIAFRVNVLFVVSNLGLNVLLVYLYGWYGAAVATTIAAGVGLVAAYRAVSTLVPVSIPTGEFLYQATAAVAMGGAVYLVRSMTAPLDVQPTILTIALVFLGAGCYFGVLVVLSPRFRETVRNNLPWMAPATG